MYEMTFENIDHPEKLNDKNTCMPFVNMVLAVLNKKSNNARCLL
jgi:ATP-dependent Clp protease adapter protein ClpS